MAPIPSALHNYQWLTILPSHDAIPLVVFLITLAVAFSVLTALLAIDNHWSTLNNCWATFEVTGWS